MEKVFKYRNQSLIRTVYSENGEIWFVGVDVCETLEYQNPQNIIKTILDEDERKLTDITDRSGQKRKVWVISESGLYSLVITSTKPEAKQFKKWITHEVLPSIRKAGIYSTDVVQAKQVRLQDVRDLMARKKIELENAKGAVNTIKDQIKELENEFWEVFNTDPKQLKLFSPEQMEQLRLKQ